MGKLWSKKLIYEFKSMDEAKRVVDDLKPDFWEKVTRSDLETMEPIYVVLMYWV